MTSINPEINSLFDAYLVATGLEMPLTLASERWCQEALSEGLTPDDITLSIAWRKAFNARGSAKKSLMLYKMLLDADSRACVLNEAAEMRAKQRVRVMDPARADVLKATHRPATMPETDAVKVDALPLIKALRDAAGGA